MSLPLTKAARATLSCLEAVTWWLIDFFAIEQAYFIYAELLHLSFPKEKEGKKEGIAEKRVAENLTGVLADSYPHCNEQGREGGPGAALFLESRGKDEGDGQGKARCAKHIGNSSKRGRTEWWQAQFA